MALSDTSDQITVDVTSDAMTATLEVPQTLVAEAGVDTACLAALRGRGLRPDQEAVQRLADAIAAVAGTDDDPVRIELRGRPAVHGEDGFLEWAERFDPNREADGPTSDESGRVDHYSQARFMTVESGETIARIVEPTSGEDGVNLKGKVMAARAGKPCPVTVDTESISIQPDGKCVAMLDGVVRFERQRLSVHQALQIPGPVDFSTGHIRFDGDVYVRGGVKDRFVVAASGHVEVEGLIEAGILEAGGDLNAGGGIAAREQGKLTVGGTMRARYLDSVSGQIKGDLEVDREIIQSELIVGGRLVVERGALIGGTAVVVRQVVLGQLGAAGETPTELVLGRVPQFEGLLDRIDVRRSEIAGELGRMDEELARIQSSIRPSAEERERVTELLCERNGIAERQSEIDSKAQALRERYEAIRRVDLKVIKAIHPATMLRVGTDKFRFGRTLRGPLRIVWDKNRRVVIRMGEGMPSRLAEAPGVQLLESQTQAA